MLRSITKLGTLFLLTTFLILSLNISAHCDAENGPVAVDARKALETGNFDAVAIWVGEDQSEELRNKFEEALAVYKMNGEAKKLAEKYFVETAIRLHREAEGMPYTGVKPAQPLPEDIAKAELALEKGELNIITDLLTKEVVDKTEKWFQNALEAKKIYKGKSIDKGREWVDAYVKYIIFVHGLYQTIQAGPAHGVGE